MITFAIRLVKYITSYFPDGKSTINHCCGSFLQMIIIIGKYITIQTELGTKTSQFITCPLEEKYVKGTLHQAEHSSTIYSVLMKNVCQS